MVAFLSCNNVNNRENLVHTLTLLETWPLEIDGPSGLALNPNGEYLWTVSDATDGHIYKISKTGQVLETLTYQGDDLEGITVDARDGTLWVVEERLREIVKVARNGQILLRIKINVEQNRENDGLEGITFNPNINHIYIVNEKNPMQFIELDASMEIVRSVPIDFKSPFNVTDLSGLAFDATSNEIWFLSDESAKIVVTDLQLTPKRVYLTRINKGEGIALDTQNNKVYLVSDDDQALYVFSYPPLNR